MKRNGNTKERILVAARDLIWKHGYSHVTIDAICEEIDIKKGSFYHFYDNKAALAVVAFGALWDDYKPLLDRIFAADSPPLKRLQNYLRFLHKTQMDLKQKHGRVMGCPFCLLASELSQREEMVGVNARAILDNYPLYLETTLRDARAEGSVVLRSVSAKVLRLCAYVEGCLQQARIQNDLAVLRNLTPGVWDLLGIEAIPSRNGRSRGRINHREDLGRIALAS
jgi:TetR/AcrR family transcriptional repressor of nem operon